MTHDKARKIETQAWNCDEWPEWLHKIVDETCEVADRLDMSAEQAHAFAVLTALAEKNAAYTQQSELAAQYLMRAERAEAQLAEKDKALGENDILLAVLDLDSGSEHDFLILETLVAEAKARRAREAQGGE